MAPLGMTPKKKKPPVMPSGFDPAPGFTENLAEYNRGLPQMWRDLITSDPEYQQELADILAGGFSDKASLQEALRSALIRFGGAGALGGIQGQLGAQPGFENLVDQTTIGAAGAADTAGTSLMSQLAKQHAQQNLAIEDINAAKGILSSGQTGFELGEERQRNTIARSDATNQLLDYLRGGIGNFTQRENQRNRDRAAALANAGQRVRDYGLSPPPPPVAPATPPALMQQLIRNSRRPARRPIRENPYG